MVPSPGDPTQEASGTITVTRKLAGDQEVTERLLNIWALDQAQSDCKDDEKACNTEDDKDSI